MFLATTGLAEFWDMDQELLLSGEWCKTGNEKLLSTSKDNISVIKYPWNDRKKLFEAYQYTNKKYEIYLSILVEFLNNNHNQNYSRTYWEKIVGIWLRYFIQTFYDRYSIVKIAIENNSRLSTIILPTENSCAILPYDFNSFFKLYTKNHLYNLIIFGQIIFSFSDRIDINEAEIMDEPKIDKKINKSSISTLLFKKIYNYANETLNISPYYIYKTGLPLIRELQLALSVKSLPIFNLDIDIELDQKLANYEVRCKNLESPSLNEFDKIISKYLLRHLPFVYLEGYHTLYERAVKTRKKPPKAFLTSNSMVGDEILKIKVAHNCEQGSKLMINQHGGHYGAGAFYPLEDHETKIADYFLSWGWKDNLKKSVIPFWSSILSYNGKKCYNDSGNILIATVSSPLYTKYYYSAPLSSQVLEEFKMHQDLIDNLPLLLRNQIVYRLKKEYGWDECGLLAEKFPMVKIEIQTEISFKDSLLSCRLFIATYNATIFLQSFSLNIPTMILWKKEFRELREEARPYYILLEDAGILYSDPLTMACKIISINNNIWEWWTQEKVQNAKNIFCDYYAKESNILVSDYKNLIQQMAE